MSGPGCARPVWGGVLLRPVIDSSQGLHIRLVEGNQPQDLYFQPAPPGAAPGKALALGVGAVCGSLAEEVGRIEALGARTLSEHEDAAGSGRVTMADP
ncbi:VOC family protein [Streptomyces sp. NBC_00829]|uniref:VOC family protein n=1 Tax=Streptomyces sp. NBC_00829 TaxID=2903679 RepID=UPI00386FC383